MWINELELTTATSPQRPSVFFCFDALSHGETGERHHQIRKPWVTLGTREREWIKPFPSLHSPNRPSHFIGIRKRSFCIGERGLCPPTPGYLPSSVLFFFFLPHFDPGRKQDSNQFHVFLFFHFLNIVTSYMKVWQFRFWSKWSLISYLDSGASIASSTKFLPVKRYFSFQLAKKPFNMTLICFIFLLLMHRFFKNSCLNASYLC